MDLNLKKSYYHFFYDKLLSEGYVCLKNVIDQIVQSQLVSLYPKQDRDSVSKIVYGILNNNKKISDLEKEPRELKNYEKLSLIYSDFKIKDINTHGIEDYKKKIKYIVDIFELYKGDFKKMYIDKQKELYSIEEFFYEIPDSKIVLDEKKEYLYFDKTVEIKRITSLAICQDFIKEIKEKNISNLFFRGHTDSNFCIAPSISRSKNLLENESSLYEQMLIKNPQEFTNISIHLDLLKKMQHYDLPTRLLDITQNILISLYFATETNDNLDGEVIIFTEKDLKYTRSDNVTVLCSLAFCNDKMKKSILSYANNYNPIIDKADYTPEQIKEFNENMEMKQLLHEITSEKRFLPEIKPDTFKKNYFVLPTMDNERITRQSGCFIVSALNKEGGADINKKRVKLENKRTIYIIPSAEKKDIREELDNFGINKSFVYPEISEVAKYLKDKY